ncbi:MAG: hypothetical protein Q8M08_16270 [Bacteroidales bacterium]|nr:hypothetical protein [Bacteroidales bacterium]
MGCPTTGDPCLDILTVPGCGTSFNISPTTGTGLLDPDCSGANEQGTEQIFSFTPDNTGLHAIGITSNNNGDALSLSYKAASGGCNSTGWNCINNGFTGTPEYFITLTGGTEYYFLFDRLYNNTTNTETFTAKFICPGANDPCTGIKSLTCGITETDTITSNLGFLNASCSGSDEEGEEQIYSFTTAVSDTYTIDFQSNNNADGLAILYREAGSGCNNTGWICLSNSFTGTGNLNVSLTAGMSYYFMFDREFTNQANEEIYSFIFICPGPVVFNVTGGGGFCPGGPGLTIGLDGSETGVDYQLIKDGADFGASIPGTGSPLAWDNMLEGIYTVKAITTSGTTNMNGSAVISLYALPVPTITGLETVCRTSSSGIAYATEPGMSNYLWTVSAGGTITAGNGTAEITVNWAGSGTQTVYVSYNSTQGCPAAEPTVLIVTVYSTPDAPGPITGLSDVCISATGVIYSVPPMQFVTSYNWTVPLGASITSGTGTNEITVDFPNTPSTGNFSVIAENPCSTGPPLINYPVNINPQLEGQLYLNNITIENNQVECQSAQNITVGGAGTPFLVLSGGQATLIASENIMMLQGTMVKSGGYLHGFITTQCIPCSSMKLAGENPRGNGAGQAANPEKELSRIFPNPNSGKFTLTQQGEMTYLIVKVEI